MADLDGPVKGGGAIDAAEEFEVLADRQVFVEREFLRPCSDGLLDLLTLGAHVEAGNTAGSRGGRRMPVSMRMVVDFPAPWGRGKPKICPSRTRNEM